MAEHYQSHVTEAAIAAAGKVGAEVFGNIIQFSERKGATA
jgi:hypothetical protein